MSLKDSDRIAAEFASRSLSRFIREAWEQVEPTSQFRDNWHIGAICEHLEAMKAGQITKLVINIPPGHMKSLTCSVFWLPWWWTSEPHIRSIHASYSSDLSQRDGRKSIALLTSPWYRARYGHKFDLAKQTEGRVENNKGGLRIATSVGGLGTGERGHVVVNDDLMRANDAHSEATRKTAIDHLEAMSTRGIIGYPFRELLIMQRLHADDPTGHVLKNDWGYEHLCLPAEFDRDISSRTSIGFVDPRKDDGELLWPEAVSASKLAEYKVSLGTYGYAGQYQQRPSPAGGGIFRREWWRYFTPATIPPTFSQKIQSWDTGFKKGADNDPSVCTTWGVTSNGWYVLDLWKGKLEFPELKRQVVALHAKWSPSAVLVEDAASGQSLIQELQRETMLPIRRVTVSRDKVSRAYAITPLIEAGKVYLPESAPWLADFLQELDLFPNVSHDDQVDSLTQALDHLTHNSTTGMLDFYAMQVQKLKGGVHA